MDDVLQLLCLAKSKHRRVAAGGISPSQQRRLLLAHALVQLPPVLLVQELLSSLSPACALDVLFALDAMAGRGMNVVVHIQQLCQPGFGMFDTVRRAAAGVAERRRLCCRCSTSRCGCGCGCMRHPQPAAAAAAAAAAQVLVMCQGMAAYQGPPQLSVPYFTAMSFQVPLAASSATHTILDIASGGVPCTGRDPVFPVRGCRCSCRCCPGLVLPVLPFLHPPRRAAQLAGWLAGCCSRNERPCGRCRSLQVGQLSEQWHKKGATWLALVDLQRADVLHQDQPGVVPAVLQLVFDEFQRWGAVPPPGARWPPALPVA